MARGGASLFAAAKAIIVRVVYAVNGIIMSFFVHNVLQEDWVFLINVLLVASVIEAAITIKYKRKGEWTWFIPSVFIYMLWVVPCIIVLEIYALNYRIYFVGSTGTSSCPITFYDECRERLAESLEEESQGEMETILGHNTTKLNQDSHDLGRRYSMLSQQIMMLVIIFGRWMAPKGKLSRDQLSSLLLALTAMALDMLEFSTDSLSIEAVACDKVYVGFIFAVWCWSLLQIPLGLTAVKQRKPRVAGPVEHEDSSNDSAEGAARRGCGYSCKTNFCCCCESEIWALAVSIFMQDGPYLVLRLYIMFSTGYIGETLIFFAAKNALIVSLQSYRIIVKVNQHCKKKNEGIFSSFRGNPAVADANRCQVVISEDVETGSASRQDGDKANDVVVTITHERSDDSSDDDGDDDESESQGKEELQDDDFKHENELEVCDSIHDIDASQEDSEPQHEFVSQDRSTVEVNGDMTPNTDENFQEETY